MANPIDDIPARLITLMKADSSFDDLDAFLIGEFYRIPMSFYPMAEVVSEIESPAARKQTGFLEREVSGFVRFSVMQQDIPSLSARVATVSSYTAVVLYANALVAMIKANPHLNLPTIGSDGYLIDNFQAESGAQFGLGQRDNNFENQAIVPWTCRIKQGA